MAKAKRSPTTRAVLALREAGVDFEGHLYDYQERGGTRVSARELGVDEHHVVKTLVMEDEHRKPLIVLQHGDKTVSTKALARHLGVKFVQPCNPTVAERHSGYKVGGTSPFATKQALPVYVEWTILELDRIFINGGARGFLVSLAPAVLESMLGAEMVEVAVERHQ